MIASLSGTVEYVGADSAVIDVGGIGHLVRATPGTLSLLTIGERAHVKTSLVVREDSLTLFAFADNDEREVFETVQSVSGIGPRIALALLAVLTPDGLRRAVHGADVKAISRVPGIGPKTAQRVLLELSGKLAAPTGTAGEAAAPAGVPGVAEDARDQVVAALVSLGYKSAVAEEALAAYLTAAGVTIVAPADVAITLRAVLRSLAARR
ncbi:MAG: Holliday junction branch migration protein RuvA [Cellulomonadaceae bacterium]|jgi:Holliday junction DNA helicase RuvA|nr:Holliday junction branch migration protein RuvA [Cellulomonadaceae bacterium]